jgi:hypothetical protein
MKPNVNKKEKEFKTIRADFLAGVKAKKILSTDEFIPWEKVKKELQKKNKSL